ALASPAKRLSSARAATSRSASPNSSASSSRRRTEGNQMSRLYGSVHRALQDRFDTRRLADSVEARLVLTEIPPEHKAFIESRDMFFLSTIDHQGRPTVSYKGGDPGFV